MTRRRLLPSEAQKHIQPLIDDLISSDSELLQEVIRTGLDLIESLSVTDRKRLVDHLKSEERVQSGL
jgi:hypothetical protein